MEYKSVTLIVEKLFGQIKNSVEFMESQAVKKSLVKI